MKMNRIAMTALVVGLLLPAVSEAQTVVAVGRRGMLGFASNVVVRNGQTQRVVMDVVKDSPAEKAGVAVGDTIVRFNGLQPTNEVLAAFQPGDTVTLRVRRDGRERDLRVVAGDRGNVTIAELPDGIRNRVAITIDAMRAELDTITFPRLRIERMGNDTAIVFFGGDRLMTIPGGREHMIHLDTIRTLMLRSAGELRRAFPDSAFIRVFTDTSHMGVGSRFRMRGDTAIGDFEIFTVGPRGRLLIPDTAMVMRPGELVRRSFSLGMRAIAGAELFELNPSLGDAVGTREGVLVLSAAEGTPAARAGLRGGDVIVNADGEPVTTIASLRRVVDRARAGSAIKLEVMRLGTRTTVELQRQ